MKQNNNKDTIINEAMKKPGLIVNNEKTTDLQYIYNIVNTTTGDKKMFLAFNEKQAKQIFLTTANNSGIFKPEEFELELVGNWNKISGVLTSVKNKYICTGKFEKQLDNELKNLISELVKKELEKERAKNE